MSALIPESMQAVLIEQSGGSPGVGQIPIPGSVPGKFWSAWLPRRLIPPIWDLSGAVTGFKIHSRLSRVLKAAAWSWPPAWVCYPVCG
jgi:hypothetical protein